MTDIFRNFATISIDFSNPINMFRIPPITKNLLIINVLMFAATFVFQRVGVDFETLFGLHFFLASDFSIYQLITYMFMHGNFQHLFFNMFALWMFGRVVESVWGPKKFLTFYFVCGIGAGLVQEVSQLVSLYMLASDQIPGFVASNIMEVAHNSQQLLNMWTTVGASGAIYGILLAFGMLFPEERIFIFPLPVPIKAKWFVCLYVVIELLMALTTPGDQVAHFAHLGGMLFGYLLIKYWRNGSGNNYFGRSKGQQFFDKLKQNWEQHNRKRNDNFSNHANRRSESDWEYNQRKKAEEDELDRILDKIKRSGYDSLTDEEKKKLFDNSRK